MIKLTPEQLMDLKNSLEFGDLESRVEEDYWLRRPRPLVGDNSILMRTIGEKFLGPSNYQRTYFDNQRGKNVKTEFAEFMEALKLYDSFPSEETKIELYMEAGDILFKKATVDLKHRKNPRYAEVNEKFTTAISYVEQELSRRGLSIGKAKRSAIIKYGVRIWLDLHGLDGKDKDLEKKFCLEELGRH